LAITDDDWVKAMNAAAGALTTSETMLEVSQSSGAAGKGKVPELKYLVGVAKQLVAVIAKTDRTKSPERPSNSSPRWSKWRWFRQT
jgi:hypothetical protein